MARMFHELKLVKVQAVLAGWYYMSSPLFSLFCNMTCYLYGRRHIRLFKQKAENWGGNEWLNTFLAWKCSRINLCFCTTGCRADIFLKVHLTDVSFIWKQQLIYICLHDSSCSRLFSVCRTLGELFKDLIEKCVCNSMHSAIRVIPGIRSVVFVMHMCVYTG